MWCACRFAPADFSRRNAFTLVEMLSALAILVVLMALLFSLLAQTSKVFRFVNNKIGAFQQARDAFDALTRTLSQATLNTYLDYNSETSPQYYLRQSQLQFVMGQAGTEPTGVTSKLPGLVGTGEAVFFQAPLGVTNTPSEYGSLNSTLNTCGFYITFSTNPTAPSFMSTASNPYRYRLMEMCLPTELDYIYRSVGSINWFTASQFLSDAQPLADNIVLLLIQPQDPASTPSDITTNYSYVSTLNTATLPAQSVNNNQLPPVLMVTMVAIDEASARQIQNGSTAPAAITNAALGKFTVSANYASDLASFESALTAAHIHYQVFSSAIPMRESKWTK
jgi:uncharacterized protein (TIGR02599 family)